MYVCGNFPDKSKLLGYSVVYKTQLFCSTKKHGVDYVEYKAHIKNMFKYYKNK